MAPIRRNRKDAAPQIGIAASLEHADGLVQETIDHRSEQSSTGLELEHVSNISSWDHNKLRSPGKPYNEHDPPLVLNGSSSLSVLEKNPSLHPSKLLEDVHHQGASASDATIGPARESEAMRKWKEIKQNGFLSHPHGGMPTQPPEPVKKKRVRRSGIPLDTHGSIPMPSPQHGKGSTLPGGMPMPPAQHSKGSSFFLRPPGVIQMPPPLQVKGSNFLSHPQRGIVVSPQPAGKKHDVKQSRRKEVDLERNTETATREQADKFKSAPPSGLLSGLNIGVIRRIRNQKEVLAILEALMQPEKADAQMQSTFIIQLGSEENNDTTKDKIQFTQGISTSILPISEQGGKRIALDNVDERSHPHNSIASPRFPATSKKLSSAVTVTSDIASRLHGVDFSAEQAPFLSPSSEWMGKSLESHDSVENILCESATGSLSMLDHTKKLPLAVITPSEIVTKACGSDLSMEQENIFSLSKKGLS